jgi:predicted CXXCH cytochrome family protein
MLLFCVGIAQAAFDNSHHDMTTYASQAQSCFHCHGRPATVALGSATASLGTVGGVCISRCHSNVNGVITRTATTEPTPSQSIATATAYTPAAVAADYTSVYFDRTHGNNKGMLRDSANAVVALTNAATWPYVSVAGDNNLQCTSCHAVHDSANAPFLWAPLAPTDNATRNGFCDRCHSERATNNMSAALSDGNHPVDFIVNSASAAGRGGNRHPRRINIQGYGTARIFDVTNPAAASMTGAVNSWNMGGHLTSGQNAAQATWTATGTQIMGCYTCHSAHRTPVNAENNLTVIANYDNNATNGGWNPLCVGCHGPSTTWDLDRVEDEVGTTLYGHPVGANTRATGGLYTTSVGNIQFAVATPAWTNGPTGINENNQYGSAGQILCTSCHKVHFGQANSMSIANLGQAAGRAICKQCHNGNGIVNVHDASKGGVNNATTGHNAPNSHHVTHAGAMTVPGTVGKVGDTTTVLNIARPSWANTTTGLGDISGGMDCADCHLYNNTAHNW